MKQQIQLKVEMASSVNERSKQLKEALMVAIMRM